MEDTTLRGIDVSEVGWTPPTKLVVHFEALGISTDRVKQDWSIQSDYLTSTDGFTFTLIDPGLDQYHLEMQPVELTLDGNQQCLGRIDRTETGDVPGEIKCQGRDYISDLVENNVDPAMVIKESMTLGDVIVTMSSPCGITTVLGPDDFKLRNVRSGKKARGGSPKDFRSLKLQDLKVDPGSGNYETLNRLVARHGATLQPTDRRDKILLEAPDYEQDPLYTLRRAVDQPRAQVNNIITAHAVRDFSSFPTHTLFRAKSGSGNEGLQQDESAIDILELADAIGGELAEILDKTVVRGRRKPGDSDTAVTGGMLYRLLYQKDDDSRTREQLDRVARRSVGERLKETLIYTVTLRGPADPITGAIWATNTIVDVKDAVARVSEQLWVASREIGPTMTKLQCWRKGAFVL